MENQYPIGRFTYDSAAAPEKRAEWRRDIADLPGLLRRAVEGLAAGQLDTPYRDGGWTVRQLVHHIADSHMNAFTRFKLALTENSPRIKPYDQDAWATQADAAEVDIELSLRLLDGLHGRWAVLLSRMAPSDYGRTFVHPERGVMSLDHTLQMYSWHSRHHVAHILGLREKKGWR